MSDRFSPDQRSAVMRAVRSAGTKPELRVRTAARRCGAGYRLGGWGLPGKPDLVFPGRRKVVLVHGCFWHGHTCARGARPPRANSAYWSAKIDRNRQRDALNLAALTQGGWDVLVIWECETNDSAALTIRVGTFLQ